MKKLTFLPRVATTALFLVTMILLTSCGKGWTQLSPQKNDLSYKTTWDCQFSQTRNKAMAIENCSLLKEDIGEGIELSDLKNFEYRMKNITTTMRSPFFLVPVPLASTSTTNTTYISDIAGSRYELSKTAETLKNHWSATHLIQTSKTASKKTEEKMTVAFPDPGVLSNQVVIEFRLMVVSEPVPSK